MVLQAFPSPIPGPQLKAERKRLGIQQKALADRLGLTDKQVRVWEGADDLDLIRSTRYQEALAALAGESIAAARAG